MSNAPQGYCTFPGIGQVLQASFTMAHGISPSVCRLEMVPQSDFSAQDGDLTFWFDGVPIVTLTNCRVDQQTIRVNDDGMVWALSIFDRRWKWLYGEISGRYNIRNPDMGGGLLGNSIDPNYQATPQQLAALCLQAMGETNFDVTLLPQTTYPETSWANENPARALQQLVEELGCRVVLQAQDSILIVPTAVGLFLPDGPVLADSLTINPPERPDSLKVVCGKTRYQLSFKLEAVGQDVDGTIVPIDQLSYTPTTGWASEFPGFCANVSDTPNSAGQVPQQYAQRTVCRWYRIALANPDGSTPLYVPSYGTIDRLEQLLPIEEDRVDTFIDNEGQVRSLPALVFGVYCSEDLGFVNTDPGTIYGRGFSIDREKGIVQFDNPVYIQNPGTIAPATLTLMTATSIHDSITGEFDRMAFSLVFPDPVTTGPRMLAHDEIEGQVVVSYDGAGHPGGATDNSNQVQGEATYYLNAAALEYITALPEQKHYAGLLSVSLDGAIQEVTWSVGPEVATTRVGWNNEFDPHTVPFRARRTFEDMRGNVIRQFKKAAARATNENRPPNVAIVF